MRDTEKGTRMHRALARSLAVSFCLLATAAAAQTLPLPNNLVVLQSEQGDQFLRETQSHAAYLQISSAFVTQKNQGYCGIASMVMALNAIHAPAPTTPDYQPYHIFTQDNVLDERTDTVLPREVLNRQGTTLDQLGQMMNLYQVRAETHHAVDGGLDEFRTLASSYLAQKNHFVVINFLRKSIGEETGGHISPLAAYDAKADRFLMLDVARYKYPPVWVKTEDLFTAMNTPDSVNDNKHRGYVLISNVDATPVAATH
jgi:Phytochelatin synthase